MTGGLGRSSVQGSPFKLRHSVALAKHKGEDRAVVEEGIAVKKPGGHLHGHSNELSCYAILDGHNGSQVVSLLERELLPAILSALDADPRASNPNERALNAIRSSFVAIDAFATQSGDFQTSGSAATVVIVDGRWVTVGNVGDCEACLVLNEGVIPLTVNHRLDSNRDEVARLTAAGAEVGRLSIGGGEVGPTRVWPGGLAVGRAIGDVDVGPAVVAVPDMLQFSMPSSGGRLVIASDGVWDALSFREVASPIMSAETSKCADIVVKAATAKRGVKDDTTAIVLDFFPEGGQHADKLSEIPEILSSVEASISRQGSAEYKPASKVPRPLSTACPLLPRKHKLWQRAKKFALISQDILPCATSYRLESSGFVGKRHSPALRISKSTVDVLERTTHVGTLYTESFYDEAP
eukprot:jgi/Mesvir1/6495/Mv16764-RA.1